MGKDVTPQVQRIKKKSCTNKKSKKKEIPMVKRHEDYTSIFSGNTNSAGNYSSVVLLKIPGVKN